MHIVIGLITAIAGLIWALNSLQNAGFDLNSLNPFTWLRRRRWEKKFGTKPLHALTDSMEVAAVLVTSVAKVEGEITRETKMEILEIFEEEFGIKRNRSIELFSSSIYLLGDVLNMEEEVRHVVKPSKDTFTESHINKLISMLKRTAKLEGEPSEGQVRIMSSVEKEFLPKDEKPSKW